MLIVITLSTLIKNLPSNNNSSGNQTDLVHVFISSQKIQKNLYYETFLVYFDIILKKNHVKLY